MRNRAALSVSILICVLNLGCKTVPPVETTRLRLSTVESLKIQVDDQARLESIFGKPDRILDIPSNPKIQRMVYVEGPYQTVRLSLKIDRETKKLVSIYWGVLESDPENDLDNLKKRYRDYTFVSKNLPWTNPHASPFQRLLVDEKKGLTITYQERETFNEVACLSWKSSPAL